MEKKCVPDVLQVEFSVIFYLNIRTDKGGGAWPPLPREMLIDRQTIAVFFLPELFSMRPQ